MDEEQHEEQRKEQLKERLLESEMQDLLALENFPFLDNSEVLPEISAPEAPAVPSGNIQKEGSEGRTRSRSVNVATPMRWDKPPPAAPLKHNVKWAGNSTREPVLIPFGYDKAEWKIFDEMLRIRRKTALRPAPPSLLERRHKDLEELELDTEENVRLRDNVRRPYPHAQGQPHYRAPLLPRNSIRQQSNPVGNPAPGTGNRRSEVQFTETAPATQIGSSHAQSNSQNSYRVRGWSELSDEERELRGYFTQISTLRENGLVSQGIMDPRNMDWR